MTGVGTRLRAGEGCCGVYLLYLLCLLSRLHFLFASPATLPSCITERFLFVCGCGAAYSYRVLK